MLAGLRQARGPRRLALIGLLHPDSADTTDFCPLATPPIARRVRRTVLAATNKYLAQSNKSRTAGETTNKHNRVRSQQQGPSTMKRVKGPDETDVAVGRRGRRGSRHELRQPGSKPDLHNAPRRHACPDCYRFHLTQINGYVSC